MKRKSIRLLSFFMAVLMLLGISVSGIAQSAPASEDANFNATGYPIVNEKITLTFAATRGSTPANTPNDLILYQKLEEITNIHIEWIMVEDEQYDVFFAAGNYPDLFYSAGPSAGILNRVQTYGVEGGRFADWNDYLQYMSNLSSMFEEQPSARKLVTEMNGEIYLLPTMNRASTGSRTRMMIRTDMLDTLGVGMPKTIDEFYTTMKAAYEGGLTDGYSPFVPHNLWHFENYLEPFFFASFGESVDPDYADDGNGGVTYNRISEQYKNYLKFLNKMYSEKLMDQEYLTMDGATADARTRAGQLMVDPGMQTILPEDFADGQMHIDQIPPLTSEFTDTQKTKGYNVFSVSGGLMNKDTKYAKELARYIDCYFAKDELVPDCGIDRESFYYGIRGVDFDTIDGELIQRVPEEYSELSHNNYLLEYVRPYWSFSWWDNLAMGGTPNSLARQMGYVKNNIPYQVQYFPVDEMKYTADELTVLNNYNTEIKTYVTEMRGKFIAGIADIDSEWDTYVSTVEGMHLSEVLAAYKTAYDRWLKN